jgi:uncharacterized metal-binding protein
MPNGKCHSAATIAATSAFLSYFAAGVVVTSTTISEYNEWAGYAAFGAFLGLILEPDLDQDKQAAPLGIMRETGGNTLAKLWQFYWSPYARAIPHRSLWSHGPVIGTLGRVLYCFPLYAIPLLTWTYFFGFPESQFFAILVGLCWVDLLHFIMDFWIPRRFFPQNPYRR